LEEAGFRVDTAEDGEEAWASLQLHDYDLLMTDNNMPKVSGVELIRKLRSVDMDLPVILVSGAMPVEEIRRRPELRLAASLSKPFTGTQLVVKVKWVLSNDENSNSKPRFPRNSALRSAA
jgi:DNA-binding response OmpR family regulator